MILRDEADLLPGALESVATLGAELIVVDTGSTDDTISIARRYGARVHSIEWSGGFDSARNASLNLATNDWVLVLDADERLTREGCDRIRELTAASADAAYAFAQWTYLHDSAVIGWSPNPRLETDFSSYPGYIEAHQVRLFPRHARYSGQVHESVEPSLQTLGVNVRAVDVVVHHLGRVRSGGASARKGRLYLELGLRKIADRSTDPEAAFEVAAQLYELGLADKSGEVLEHTLALDPAHRGALNMLSKVYLQSDRVENARALAETLVKHHPKFSDGWNTLGLLELDQSNLDRAHECLARAVSVGPDNANAWANLAEVFRQRVDFDRSRECLRRARELNPISPRIEIAEIRLRLSEGCDSEIINSVAELARKDAPFSASDLVHLGTLMVHLGLMSEFVRLVERNSEVVAQHRSSGIHVGAMLEHNGEAAAALSVYERLLENYPQDALLHNAIGCLLARDANYEVALRRFSSAVKLAPKNGLYLRNTGLACERLGLNALATRCYQSLMELDTEFAAFVNARLNDLESNELSSNE